MGSRDVELTASRVCRGISRRRSIDSMALFPRPTPLPGDVLGWLETFGESFTGRLTPDERPPYLQEVRAALEPKLRDEKGTWIADYVRLRFAATKVA
jgi:hypothetical protein